MNYNNEKLGVLNKQLLTSVKKYSELYNNFDEILNTTYNTVSDMVSLNDESLNKFLVYTIYLAHYGYLENDCNIEKLKSKNKDIDFKFGYSTIKPLINTIISKFESAMVDKETPQKKVETVLLANIRDIPLEDYKNKISDDIELIYLLYNSADNSFDEAIRNLIKSSSCFNTPLNTTVNGILSIYKLTLQDSFGLTPYAGILSGNTNNYCLKIGDNYTLKNVDFPAIIQNVTSNLMKIMTIKFSSSRQFDIRGIVYSESVISFPLKILEYMFGRELTQEQNKYIYRPHVNCDNWDKYVDDYIAPQIKGYIVDSIYYSLEKNIEFRLSSDEEVSNFDKTPDFSFKDKDFQELYSRKSLEINRLLLDGRLMLHINSDLRNVSKSLCSVVALVKYNTLNNSLNSIKLRIVDIDDRLKPQHTTNLYSNLVPNDKISYEDGYNIALDVNGNIIREKGLEVPYGVFEYAHDYNYELSNAAPMFGYKVVDILNKQRKKLDWSNIVLGEDLKGSTVFASDKQGCLPISKSVYHNIFAGSRSGKGVMTLNILASAIADDKPIFYIDRKPDMAYMFYKLCGENMFIINGGDSSTAYDPDGFFQDNGNAIAGWRDSYNKIPDYVKTGLNINETYKGVFGDMVYQRALFLFYSIFAARYEFASDTDEDGNSIYEMLGGKNGVVFIIDEFSNWQQGFECTTIHGKFREKGKNISTMRSKINTLKSKESRAEAALRAKEEANLGKEKPSSTFKEESDLSNARQSLADGIDPFELYCTQFLEKYGETISIMKNKYDAAVVGKTGEVDFFVIGQKLEKKPYLGTPFLSSKDGWNQSQKEGGSEYSLTRGLINATLNDWFMGRNAETGYLNQNKDAYFKTWLVERYHWLYYNKVRFEDMSQTEDKIKGYKLFKPYLVLNGSDEPDLNVEFERDEKGNYKNAGKYTYILQCMDRVKTISGNEDIWESIRLDHLTEEKAEEAKLGVNKHYGELNTGIGFEGLINLIMSGKTTTFNHSTSLKKSADIANYVANKMGYSNYKELLFDLTPEGMFSIKDVFMALKDKTYFRDKRRSLPIYSEFADIIDVKSNTQQEYIEETINESELGLDYGFSNEQVYKTAQEPQIKPNSFEGNTEQQAKENHNSLADSIYAEETGLTLDEIVNILTEGIIEYANSLGFKLSMGRGRLNSIIYKKLSERGF